MLRRALCILILVPLASCVDGLGIVRGCEAEMREVRQRHGPPDRTEHGMRSEIWGYGNPPGGYYFEFRWGSAGEACQVIGPNSLDLLPAHHFPLPASAAAHPSAG